MLPQPSAVPDDDEVVLLLPPPAAVRAAAPAALAGCSILQLPTPVAVDVEHPAPHAVSASSILQPLPTTKALLDHQGAARDDAKVEVLTQPARAHGAPAGAANGGLGAPSSIWRCAWRLSDLACTCCVSDLLADAMFAQARTTLLSSRLCDCADAAVTLLSNAALPPRPPAIDGERPGWLLFREDHARSNGGRRRYSQPGLRPIDRWQMQGGGGTTRLPLPARLQHGDLPQVLVRRAGFVHRHQRPRLRFRQFEIQSVAVGRSAKRGPVVYIVLDDGALDPLVADVHDARPTHTVAQSAAPAGEIAVVDMPEAVRSYLQSLADAQFTHSHRNRFRQKNPDSGMGKQFSVTQETSNLAMV